MSNRIKEFIQNKFIYRDFGYDIIDPMQFGIIKFSTEKSPLLYNNPYVLT